MQSHVSDPEHEEFLQIEKQIMDEQKDILVQDVTEVQTLSKRCGENFESSVLDEHNAMIDKYIQRTAEIDGMMVPY